MERLALRGGRSIRQEPFPSWPVFGEEERVLLLEVFDSGKWWYGERVREFEEKYAAFQNAAYGVSCANGTLALEMALLACGIGAGDEVIVPPYTFVATAMAVLRANATPVFADIDIESSNLDPADAERKITSRTRAIMPVHFGGLPVDMDAFASLAEGHGLRIIEDACHSWGSQWKGKGTGALGDCGGFSFQMSKNITAGEGGILLTDDEEIADRARGYSNCGRMKDRPFYEHYLPGSNMRLTELQAAILLGQLSRLEEQTLTRERNAAYLDKHLAGMEGIALTRPDARVTRRSYHMYIFRFLKEAWGGVDISTFLEALQAEGINCGRGYPIPLYRNPLFQRDIEGRCACNGQVDYKSVFCPNAEAICREACWIPQSVLLGNERDMDDIVEAVAKVWRNRKQLLCSA